jgi:hypothetical protein
MAFTYTVIKVTSLNVGDQVVAAVVADGHAYVYPTPAASSGLQYPTVRAIYSAALPPGDSTAGDALFTVQMNNANAFALPNDWTINGNTDWIIKATGTA